MMGIFTMACKTINIANWMISIAGQIPYTVYFEVTCSWLYYIAMIRCGNIVNVSLA